MEKDDGIMSDEDVAIARQRRLDAMHLQVIEGNPLSSEDVEMFEMFERLRWSHERCLAYIMDRISNRDRSAAAE